MDSVRHAGKLALVVGATVGSHDGIEADAEAAIDALTDAGYSG